MQYHLNGFRSGDPSLAPAYESSLSDKVDVLIVGCGPAGLTLATQLALLGDISVRILERKPGPLEFGQADGIACRSVEMFEAFGFADRVIREGYQVNEVTFWRPGADGGALSRADRIPDVEDDLSEMPHIILSQARIHDFYLETMAKSARRLSPDYNRALIAVTRNDTVDHPITATFDCLDTQGETETIHAKYIIGCDGARSTVRAQMGLSLKGEAARQLWGVMDVLCGTDFPDIRLKCAIQSADAGSILIIPREGGYLVRLYIELDALNEGERAADRGITCEHLIAKAQQILAPYSFDVAEVAWWSAYEIGQRVCDAFDDVTEVERGTKHPRIFIAGDACHTHSPKAGQGMNVSMADAFNLGWKLAAVLRGTSPPALLNTYSAERRAKAQELIDFDRDMARLFSKKPETPDEAAQFQAYFKKHGRYTAGVETRYAPSMITAGTEHQALASGYPVGMRFHSAPVIRLADAKPMQLGHAFKADGRWRVLVFAPEGETLHDFFESVWRLVGVITPPAKDTDAVIDMRAVYPKVHRDMDVNALPPSLRPRKGRFGLIDYEKVFCADPADDIYKKRGIDRSKGAALLIRPDQYVSAVLPLTDSTLLSEHLTQIFGTQVFERGG